MARLSPYATVRIAAMIPARKIAAFNFVLQRWLERVLRRRFHGVYVYGAEHLRTLDAAGKVVGCANHTNWWDGFVLYVVSRRLLKHDIYLAMEEINLRRYRFFTWMGAFGIDLSDKRSALPGLRYALRLLQPGRLLWMFVQGKLLGAGMPIEVRPGALFLARRAGAQLLPLILRYEWLNESQPCILISVGRAMTAVTAADELAAVLNQLYAQLDEKVRSLDLGEAETLFPPRMSMNKRWDYVLHLVRGRPGSFDARNR